MRNKNSKMRVKKNKMISNSVVMLIILKLLLNLLPNNLGNNYQPLKSRKKKEIINVMDSIVNYKNDVF